MTILCYSTFSQTKSIEYDMREKYNAFNNYLETIVNGDKEIIIAREKINSNNTIATFKLNVIQSVDLKGNIKQDTKLYQDKEWDKLKNNPKETNYWSLYDHWTKNDFKNTKIVLENIDTKNGIQSIVDKYNNSDIRVHCFSEPIFYQNKKYILFTYLKYSISGGNPFVVVMKKINGKWIRTHECFNPNQIN